MNTRRTTIHNISFVSAAIFDDRYREPSFVFPFVICHKENIDNEGSHYLLKNK